MMVDGIRKPLKGAGENWEAARKQSAAAALVRAGNCRETTGKPPELPILTKIAKDRQKQNMVLLGSIKPPQLIGCENRSSKGIEFSDNFLAQ